VVNSRRRYRDYNLDHITHATNTAKAQSPAGDEHCPTRIVRNERCGKKIHNQESLMISDLVICSKKDKIWTLMLNRADKGNVLNIEMLQTLKAHFAAAAEEPALRTVILTGAGERVFCSGTDVSDSKRQAQIQNVLWDEVGAALGCLPLLTIGLINGHCSGRAMTLMLNCDIRISVPQARFAYPVLQNGTLPGARDMECLRALIGPGHTSALLLGGQRIHGERALS
jgi:enoyl-CoA hydratase